VRRERERERERERGWEGEGDDSRWLAEARAIFDLSWNAAVRPPLRWSFQRKIYFSPSSFIAFPLRLFATPTRLTHVLCWFRQRNTFARFPNKFLPCARPPVSGRSAEFSCMSARRWLRRGLLCLQDCSLLRHLFQDRTRGAGRVGLQATILLSTCRVNPQAASFNFIFVRSYGAQIREAGANRARGRGVAQKKRNAFINEAWKPSNC